MDCARDERRSVRERVRPPRTVLVSPDDNSLERWDKNEWYSGAMLIVDAVGVVSGVAALPSGIRNLWMVLARQKRFLARGLSWESLKAMNRAQRLMVIAEVFEDASRTPDGRAALVQAARKAEVGARTFQHAAGLSVRNADKLRGIISAETTRRLTASLRDAIGNMVGVAASGTPSSLTGSASGSVNYVINLVASGGAN
jgi:hypothetical protein